MHYSMSSDNCSFVTRGEFLSSIPSCFAYATFVETAGYPVAERCPLMVVELGCRGGL